MDEFTKLVSIVKKLRSKNGCLWDKAQKVGNLKTYLLEEVYELIDAIDGKDNNHVAEELGDAAMLLVFIAQLYDEKNMFTMKDALKKINEKLIARHPHVFSKKRLKSRHEIVSFWIKEKSKKKKRTTIFERLPLSSPSLLLAYILFKESGYITSRRRPRLILKEFDGCMRKLSKGRVSCHALVDAVLLACELAACYSLDLETALRRKVLKKAKGAKYRKI